MINSQDLNWAIDSLAKRAIDAIHTDEQTGWRGVGQFFDAPKDHRQVGTFGCAAAAIAIHGSQSKASTVDTCLETLEAIWSDWKAKGSKGRRFVQTYKLAYMLLALNTTRHDKFDDFRIDITNTLIEREIESGGWSSWWISKSENGNVIDIPSTALVILAFCTHEPNSINVVKSIEKLNEFLNQYPNTTIFKTCLCLAALSKTNSSIRCKNFHRILNDIACSRHRLSISEPYHYFVYQYEDEFGKMLFGRDAIVAPPRITAALATFDPNISPTTQLYGQVLAADIANEIRNGDGLYRFEEDQFAGSMVQGLASLAIREAKENLKKPLWITRAYVAVFSDKPRDGIWYRFVPTLALFSVLAMTVLTEKQGLELRIASGFFAMGVGAIWGPSVLRRWLPGFK